MVHVNVGTANTVNMLANASRDRVPLILMAGRSPIMESGVFGARNRSIHWAQEMFDQAGMVRELVKWDYELRNPAQAQGVVARAVEAATASPTGPVYLTLPREPLSAAVQGEPRAAEPRVVPSTPHPDPAAIARLADWIAEAKRPLVIASNLGPGARGCRYAWPGGRALQAARRRPDAALPVPRHRPSHACGLRFGAVPGRGGSHPRHRVRRSLDAGREGAGAQGTHRPHRRGPRLPALSHARLPQRPVDRRQRRSRPGGPGGGAGEAQRPPRRRRAVDCAAPPSPAPMRRTSPRNT